MTDGSVTVRNIIIHRIRKQKDILLDQTDSPAQGLLRVFPYIPAIQQNPPLLRFIKAKQQAGNGSFACSGFPYKRNFFPGLYRQGQIPENHSVSVAEADIIKNDLAFHVLTFNSIRSVLNLRFNLHDFIKPGKTGHAALIHFRKHSQAQQRFHKEVHV